MYDIVCVDEARTALFRADDRAVRSKQKGYSSMSAYEKARWLNARMFRTLGIAALSALIAASLSPMAGASTSTKAYADDPSTAESWVQDYKQFQGRDTVSDITWFDFTGATNTTAVAPRNDRALSVGTTWEKELSPDYVVHVEVVGLKPFDATDAFKARVEGTADAALYDENAINRYRDGQPADVVFSKQDSYSLLKTYGVTVPGTPVIRPNKDGGNIGVQLKVSATYRGEPVKLDMIVASGEEANSEEKEIYTTDGEPWELLTQVSDSTTEVSYKPLTYNTGMWISNVQYPARYWGNLNPAASAHSIADTHGAIGGTQTFGDGIGTQVFGPVMTAQNGAIPTGWQKYDANGNNRLRYSLPVVVARNVSNIGIYVNSRGAQSTMLGMVLNDEGDAPASYGEATHVINLKGDMPYLGSVRPDMGIKNADSTAWTSDDDTGDADEGEGQLMNGGMYAIYRASDDAYELTVQAHPGATGKAYAKGWVDFNNNGTFDEGEGSDAAEVTADGDLKLKFTGIKQNADTSITELGTRVRISRDAKDVESPTGQAFSGEVEDFLVQVTVPPRGSLEKTSAKQGKPQTATVAFSSYGMLDHSTDANSINEASAPVMVKPDGTIVQASELDGDGYYAVSGEGRYKIEASGKDVKATFVPERGFAGPAQGIAIRRVDANGQTTGWKSTNDALENVSYASTMDGMFVPTVVPLAPAAIPATSEDIQGKPQSGKPSFSSEDESVASMDSSTLTLIDPDGNEVKTLAVKDEGTYELHSDGTVVFTPEPGFTGKASGVKVQMKDSLGNAAQTTYTPFVNPVVPTAQGASSTGEQGVKQQGTVAFTAGVGKNSDGTTGTVDLDPATAILIDGSGNPVSSLTIPHEGTYKIETTQDGNVTVSFTPEVAFTGKATGVTVQMKDKNGTPATAKYLPTVIPVAPSGNDVVSSDIQGQPQTGTPTFKGGNDEVGIDENVPPMIVDKDGSLVESLVAAGEGAYRIDTNTGTVTFSPEPSFTGKAAGITVQRTDIVGNKVTATYTPTVIPVTPVGTPATSTGKQGLPQTGTPTFAPGTVNVGGVDKSVPLDPSTLTLVDGDGNETDKVTVDGEGSYVLNSDGSITFTPNPSFTGTATGVKVQMKDKNGTPATAMYTPTVTPVTPKGTDVISTGKKGQPQTGTPVFTPGDPDVPVTISAGNPAKLVVNGVPSDETAIPALDAKGNEVGTYTIDPATGTVMFTPHADFVGTPVPATVQALDTNGTPVTATYTPTVVDEPNPVQPDDKNPSKKPQGASSTEQGGKKVAQQKTSSNSSGSKIPKTGDSLPLTALANVAIASGAASAAIIAWRRQERRPDRSI